MQYHVMWIDVLRVVGRLVGIGVLVLTWLVWCWI